MASPGARHSKPVTPRAVLAILALLAACDPGQAPGASTSTPSGGTATPSAVASTPTPTAAAPPTANPAPSVAAPSPSAPSAPSASAAPARGAGNCYPAAKSRDYGSYDRAESPYAECAASLKVHCDAGDGGRGGLHGLKLLVDVTKEARKTQPDACCYSSCK